MSVTAEPWILGHLQLALVWTGMTPGVDGTLGLTLPRGDLCQVWDHEVTLPLVCSRSCLHKWIIIHLLQMDYSPFPLHLDLLRAGESFPCCHLSEAQGQVLFFRHIPRTPLCSEVTHPTALS